MTGLKAPRPRYQILFILSIMLVSTTSLIQYDKITSERMERIDPLLLQELDIAPENIKIPAIIALTNYSELTKQIDESELDILNPYGISKGKILLLSAKLYPQEIKMLMQSGVIDAVQKDAIFLATPIRKETNPDMFMDFNEFRRQGVTGKGITVAKLDTGSAYGYEYEGIYSVFPEDDGIDRVGHGTYTEQVLRKGCPGCSVISVKILDNEGVGSCSSIIKGLDKVREIANERRIDILYGSFGSPSIQGAITSIMASSLATDKQIVSFYSAGNGGEDGIGDDGIYTPANGKYVWDVRSIDGLNEISDFSNYGEKNSYLSISDYGYYEGHAGTSFSAPRAAAKAAMVDSYYRSIGTYLTFTQKNNLIATAAKDLGEEGFDPIYGMGVMDSGSLLNANPNISRNIYKGGYGNIYIKYIWGLGLLLIGFILYKGMKGSGRVRNKKR